MNENDTLGGRTPMEFLEAEFPGADIERLAGEPERYFVDYGVSAEMPYGVTYQLDLEAIAVLAQRTGEENPLEGIVSFLDVLDTINQDAQAKGLDLKIELDLRVPEDPPI
jgi:hypothetical protein